MGFLSSLNAVLVMFLCIAAVTALVLIFCKNDCRCCDHSYRNSVDVTEKANQKLINGEFATKRFYGQYGAAYIGLYDVIKAAKCLDKSKLTPLSRRVVPVAGIKRSTIEVIMFVDENKNIKIAFDSDSLKYKESRDKCLTKEEIEEKVPFEKIIANCKKMVEGNEKSEKEWDKINGSYTGHQVLLPSDIERSGEINLVNF